MKRFVVAFCFCLLATSQSHACWFPGKRLMENRPGVLVPKAQARGGSCQSAPNSRSPAAPKASGTFFVTPAAMSAGGCANGRCQVK